MKLIKCAQCAGSDFYQEGNFMVCRFCNAKYALEKDDIKARQSTIALNSDIEALLQKCRMDPKRARKYANLILDIDPTNKEAHKYLK